MKISGLIGVVIAASCLGCVGPMSPFGSVSLGASARPTETVADENALHSRARIRFTPERQVLHGASAFSVILEDPLGVPDDFRLSVRYNGLDVSRQFLAHAEVTALDPLRHAVKLTAKNLRLLPTRENGVKVIYRREPSADAVVAHYLAPVCSAFANNQMLFTLPDFEPPLAILQLINQRAAQKNLNPYFVAALVAQESSFDPQALSRNKALGLTQVTSSGESEVIKHFAEWPRYPGVGQMPLLMLKIAILNGQIHAGNEWRLDPALSIQGGVEYLSYLSDYWSREDKRAQIQKSLGASETALTEVMLASYNSGAARVSDSLERNGVNWLKDEELGEAQKYVRRVVSYCDHFEHQEE